MVALHSTSTDAQTTETKITRDSVPISRLRRLLNGMTRLVDCMSCSHSSLIHLDYLRSLPPQSLGRSWAEFLDTHGLTPVKRGTRRQQLYRGIHLLAGYNTDAIGEAEVQAFVAGTQSRWVIPSMAIALLRLLCLRFRNGLPSSALASTSSEALFQRLSNAYWRGRRSVLDPNTWQPEMLWDLPLSAVQQWFRV